MRHWRMIGLVGTALAVTVGIVPSASASPSVSAAGRALHRAVEHRYPDQTAERSTLTKCRKIAPHHHLQFSCLYGIRANVEDVTHDPTTYWIASGLAQVYPRGAKLRVELLSPLTRGGKWAPYPSRIEAEALKRAEEEANAAIKSSEEQTARAEAEAKAYEEQFGKAEAILCGHPGCLQGK